MKALNFIFIFVAFFCCGKQNKISKQFQECTYQVNQSVKIIKYTYEGISYKQIVEIKNLSDAEVSFKITTEDKKEKKSSIIQGVARRKINEDPEQDVNEIGEPYDSFQYIYSNGECKLSIRIAKDKKDLLKLDNFRCNNLLGERDGFFTLGVLLRRISSN